MDLFPDGAHVRLRSRSNGRYFHADDDGIGVSSRPVRASLASVWAVHRVVRDGAAFALLQGAAYGRYLAIWEVDVPAGGVPDIGNRVVRFTQVQYNAPEQEDVLWHFFPAGDGNDDVLMWSPRCGFWPPGQDVAVATRWVVEVVPPRAEPPALPGPGAPILNGGPIHENDVDLPGVLEREIRFVRADEQGNFQENEWGVIVFLGESVFMLRRYLAEEVEEDELNITLCVRGGSHGRLTPLVVDLPYLEFLPIDIVVFVVGSPAANALVHPDVDAP